MIRCHRQRAALNLPVALNESMFYLSIFFSSGVEVKCVKCEAKCFRRRFAIAVLGSR